MGNPFGFPVRNTTSYSSLNELSRKSGRTGSGTNLSGNFDPLFYNEFRKQLAKRRKLVNFIAPSKSFGGLDYIYYRVEKDSGCITRVCPHHVPPDISDFEVNR
ncbi:hypothetical protein H4219_002021, partial [Mycoemilia scoparia]